MTVGRDGGGVMATKRVLLDSLLDAPMQRYFERKFASLPAAELRLRHEETLRFLFIAHECTGAIPVSREIDEVWHAWILQTQQYEALCRRLPTGEFIHHSSNDYLVWFDPAVGNGNPLDQDVKMLALYVANFGPFEAPRAAHWLLARHLIDRHGWTVDDLNDWLQTGMDGGSSANATQAPSRREAAPALA